MRVLRFRSVVVAVVVSLLSALVVFVSAPTAAQTAEETDPSAPPPAPGEPVAGEVAAMRGERSRTFVDGDGRFRTELHAGPIHFRDAAGDWQAIDRSWHADDAGWRNGANRFEADLPATLADAVRVSVGSSWVSFRLEGAASSTAVVDGAVARYPGVLDGVDVEYTGLADAVKEELVLASASSVSRFVFGVELAPGLSLRPTEGGFEVVDRAGAVVLSSPAAVMVDANGATAPVAVSVGGSTVTVDAGGGWLADPARVFPVRVDPTLSIGGLTDCGIASNSATANCAATSLPVGSSGGVTSRALVDFTDLASDVPRNAIVFEAVLELTTTSTGNGTAMAVNAHPVTAGWDPNATWADRTASATWATAGGDFDAGVVGSITNAATAATHSMLVTGVVTDWLRDDRDQHGFLLKAASENGANTVAFGSLDGGGANDPRLEVTWERDTGRPGWETQAYTYAISDRADLAVDAQGYLSLRTSDLFIAGTGVPTVVDRWFNSTSHYLRRTNGYGWQLAGNLGPRVAEFDDRVVISTGDRGHWVFEDTGGGTFASPAGVDATLTESAGVFTLEFHRDGSTWTLDDPVAGIEVVTAVEDRNGNTVTVDYVTGAVEDGSAGPDDINDTRSRVHDITRASNRVELITDSAGRTVDYAYTGSLLTSVEDAEGHTTTYAYDAENNLTRITDNRGNDIKIAYTNDFDGVVDTITHVTDVPNDTGPTWDFGYGGFSDTSGTMLATTTVTDPRGNTTTYERDTSNRVTKVTDDLGHEKDTTWTANNNVATFTDALSAVQTLNYDANNNLLSAVAPPSAPGQTGATTRFSYQDPSHMYLPSSRVDTEGNCRSFRYDTAGNLTDVYDGLTPSGSPQNCDTGTGGPRWQQAYLANGNVDTVTDPDSNVTDYSYNGLGELTGIDHPGPLGSESFTYDTLSRVDTYTDGEGQVTEYTYDDLDRVTRITYDGDTLCASRATCIDYGYDPNGNLTSRIDTTGTTTFGYDERNLVTSKGLPGGANACSGGGTAMTYGYDTVGNLTTHCDAAGTVTYSYDDVNRLTGVAQPGGTCTVPTSQCTTFGYDDNDRRTSTTYPTSTAVVETVVYDNAGNITSISAARGGTTLTDFDYTYVDGTNDRALRQTMVTGGITTAYTYDAFGRLTRAQQTAGGTDDRSYTYDDRGNRLTETINGSTTTFTYNAANQLTSATGQTATPAYDLNGNQTTAPNGRTGVYNPLNQASSYTPSGGSALNMTYADADSTERTEVGTADHAWSVTGLVRDVNGGNTTRYFRDNRGVLIGQNRSTVRHYPLRDGLGSIVALVNSSGTVTDTYSYDPWGRSTGTTGTTVNPWRYAGGFLDTSTGLTKFGTRYYDSNQARWTQQDPEQGLPTNPRTINRYEYVGSDPVNFTDVHGDDWWDCVASVSGLTVSLLGAGLSGTTFVSSALTGNIPLAAFSAASYFYAMVEANNYAVETADEC